MLDCKRLKSFWFIEEIRSKRVRVIGNQYTINKLEIKLLWSRKIIIIINRK